MTAPETRGSSDGGCLSFIGFMVVFPAFVVGFLWLATWLLGEPHP